MSDPSPSPVAIERLISEMREAHVTKAVDRFGGTYEFVLIDPQTMNRWSTEVLALSSRCEAAEAEVERLKTELASARDRSAHFD